MCLAVPMRVVECDGPSGVVELEGIRRQVFLGFLDEVAPGDYVLIHAGCAVEKLRPEEAALDLALFRSLAERMSDLEAGAAEGMAVADAGGSSPAKDPSSGSAGDARPSQGTVPS